MIECGYPYCGRVAKFQQRFGGRRPLCGWHARLKKCRPVDRLDVKTNHDYDKPTISVTAKLYEKIAAIARAGDLPIATVSDFYVRKALDRAEAA